MKADISRLPQRIRRYTSVIMQQGRIALDSDWNDLGSILLHHAETFAGDLIGDGAGPAGTAGFELFPRGGIEFGRGNSMDQFVHVPKANFDSSQEFTFELFVRPRGSGTLVATENLDCELRLVLTGERFRVQFTRGDLDCEADIAQKNLFVHIAVTATAQSIALFLNGELAATTTRSSGEVTRTAGVSIQTTRPDVRFAPILPRSLAQQPLMLVGTNQGIGAVSTQMSAVAEAKSPPALSSLKQGIVFGSRSGALNCFKGTIAGAQLWKGVRTDAQIRENYRLWLHGPANEQLVAYWPMTEGTEIVAYDVIGNADGIFGAVASESLPAWDTRMLCIAPGRYYVHGAVCTNNRALPLDEQVDAQTLSNSTENPSTYVASLEVTQTAVSWFDDPDLREIALGGADTTARIANAWTVQLAPQSLEEWQRAAAAEKRPLLMTASRVTTAQELLGNDLYRVEINSVGEFYSSPFQAGVNVTLDGAKIQLPPEAPDCHIGQMVAFQFTLDSTDPGQVAVVVGSTTTNGVRSLVVDPVPTPRTPSSPPPFVARMRHLISYKWSRENGCEAFQVLLPAPNANDKNVLILLDSATSTNARLRVDDWVELVLPGVTNPQDPQLLYRVTDVSPDRGTVTLDGYFSPPTTLPLPDAAPAYLRRWNGDRGYLHGIRAAGAQRAQLERGIQIEFKAVSGVSVAVGDYWVMPARQLTGLIEWPVANGLPIAMPPHGPQRWQLPIAEITAELEGTFRIRDLRRSIQVVASAAPPPSALRKDKPRTPEQSPTNPPQLKAWIDVAPGLASGGADSVTRPDGTVAVIAPNTWSIFDPAKRSFGRPHAFPQQRTDTAIVLHRKLLHVIGGRERSGPDATATATARVDVYDSVRGIWSTLPALPEPRYAHSAVVVQDQIHVVGGYIDGQPSNSLVVFHEDQNQWVKLPAMTTARADAAAVNFQESLIVMGGLDIQGKPLASVEMFDPRKATWQPLLPLSEARSRLAATVLRTMVFALGGAAENAPSTRVDVFEPRDNSRMLRGPVLPAPRTDMAAATVHEIIYLFGNGLRLNDIESVIALPVGNTTFLSSDDDLPVPSQQDRGIDVAAFNGTINWAMVRQSGLTFGFVTATNGKSTLDLQFASNWANTKAAGVVRGAMHIFQPGSEPQAQANVYLAAVTFENGDLPPILALHVAPPTGVDLPAVVRQWLDAVENAVGVPPIIHTSPSFWAKYMSGDFNRYPLSVIDDGVDSPTVPAGFSVWTFWERNYRMPIRGVANDVKTLVCAKLAGVTRVGDKPVPVDDSSAIPPRSATALTGSAFAQQVMHSSVDSRDARVLGELLNGNLPNFMRTFVKVTTQATIAGETHVVEYDVMPDYLCIGSDADYLRMPMSPLTAQAVGDAFDCMLPTPLMVDQIYNAATAKVEPKPFNVERYDIQSVGVFVQSNDVIDGQLAAIQDKPGNLVGGSKKDVVTTKLLASNPGRVAIYGWQMPSSQFGGAPIQPLSTVHIMEYMDYSHGLRLVRKTVTVDGKTMQLEDLLADPTLCVLVSREGPVTQPRYVGQAPTPNPPAPVKPNPPSDPTNGSSNQTISLAAGTKGLDRSGDIGVKARDLVTSGYLFAIRNIQLPEQNPAHWGVVTAEEIDEIFGAGMPLGLYQNYRMKGITVEQGMTDGAFMAREAARLGFPTGQGIVLWCDMESTAELHGLFYGPDGAPVSVETMVAYLRNWAKAVHAGGYAAGLYNGAQNLLKSSHLAELTEFWGFWKSGSNVPAPPQGYQMTQVKENLHVEGINIDEDVLSMDGNGRLPVFWKK